MSDNKTLYNLAQKLGFDDYEKVVRKAAEFERLLQNKSMVNGSNITDTAKIVICLDLAATFIGIGFDVKIAIKYSGLKSAAYMNCRKTIENLLEVNTELTIPSLCLSLQCAGVEDLAEKILKTYKVNSRVELDLKLPQYACMAVYQACRLNKVKTVKSKIIEKSRLKPAQWLKLDAEWAKFVDEKFTPVKKKKGCPSKVIRIEEDEVELMEIDNQITKETEPQLEAYEDWKKRMLERAYKELKELEINENSLVRRSPRKTPQKFSPYKENANKAKGVKLLFPTS